MLRWSISSFEGYTKRFSDLPTKWLRLRYVSPKLYSIQRSPIMTRSTYHYFSQTQKMSNKNRTSKIKYRQVWCQAECLSENSLSIRELSRATRLSENSLSIPKLNRAQRRSWQKFYGDMERSQYLQHSVQLDIFKTLRTTDIVCVSAHGCTKDI